MGQPGRLKQKTLWKCSPSALMAGLLLVLALAFHLNLTIIAQNYHQDTNKQAAVSAARQQTNTPKSHPSTLSHKPRKAIMILAAVPIDKRHDGTTPFHHNHWTPTAKIEDVAKKVPGSHPSTILTTAADETTCKRNGSVHYQQLSLKVCYTLVVSWSANGVVVSAEGQ